MPQASDELRAKFPGWDDEALAVLEENFTENRGVIRPKTVGYVPTDREKDAIDYLFQEWDYEYQPVPEQN
jgi:hypothetical protein